MNKEDDEVLAEQDFATLMSANTEVKPVNFEKRAKGSPALLSKLGLDEGKRVQRMAAMGEMSDSLDRLRALSPEQYEPQDIMGFKQAGLQDGVYKKLRTGRYEVQAKLDLHGFRVEEALQAVLQFCSQSISDHKRCVLISHGKGIKQDQPARLKNYVACWLKNMPDVVAYHSALPTHGGAGCVYVLLKKSEQKKQENRERYNSVKNKK